MQFGPLWQDFWALPYAARVVASFLVAFSLLFIFRYLLIGLLQWAKFARVIWRLQRTGEKSPDIFERIFTRDKRLMHVWSEYRETLHGQRERDPQSGEYRVARYRSTVPAETFINREVLVDTVLATDFFRHLPGIFTGIGIIGTFYGLTRGIRAFTVSDQSEVVRNGLNSLLHEVGTAFTLSFVAIAAAMVVTVIEKFLVAVLNGRVERICQLVDASFTSGVGEEYLEKLVHSSEASAKEAKILKDALVTELKQVLENLTERQAAQSAEQSRAMADRIVSGLNDGLHGPLSQIGTAVQTLGGNQAEAVNRIMADTMAAFTAKLQDLFGDQIGGINRMQQETVAALQTSLGRMDELVIKMGQVGTSATDTMATKLEETIAAMDARQRVINAELMKVVSAVRTDVSESQAETNRKTQEAVAAMSANIGEMVRGLSGVVQDASVRDQARSDALAQRTQETQHVLSESLDKTMSHVASVGDSIRQAVLRMEQVTENVVARMNEGANTLYIASSDFAKAGAKTAETLDKVGLLSGHLGVASSALTGSSNTLAAAVSEYKTVRDDILRLVTELRVTVQSAKSEASLTENILARIEGSTRNLAAAEVQAEQYLEDVTKVLTEAHKGFAEAISRTLREANTTFQNHLTTATKMLGQTIDGLEDVLERIPVR